MDELYKIPESPQYSEKIRKLQNDDPASASETFNPLFEQIIENIAALKRMLDALSAQRPDEDTGKAEVLLDTGPITGTAEVSVIVSGVEYDAKNMSVSEGNTSEGTLILTRQEE